MQMGGFFGDLEDLGVGIDRDYLREKSIFIGKKLEGIISEIYKLAGEEFNTNFTATYNISPSGEATVVQNIKLTNKLSNVYATQYALEIGCPGLCLRGRPQSDRGCRQPQMTGGRSDRRHRGWAPRL